MNLILLLIILLIILISMNYNKLFNKNNNLKKKVRWGKKNIMMNYHLNPQIDFFDQYNNGMKGQPLYKKNINSNITKYLDNMNNSYGSTIYDTNPKKAFIPENPDNIDNIDNITAHEIINEDDTNKRVLDYRESLLEENFKDETEDIADKYQDMEVGNIYDNLVDNYRIKWGKINGLNAFDKSDHYELDNDPNDIGYTNFPTY